MVQFQYKTEICKIFEDIFIDNILQISFICKIDLYASVSLGHPGHEMVNDDFNPFIPRVPWQSDDLNILKMKDFFQKRNSVYFEISQ